MTSRYEHHKHEWVSLSEDTSKSPWNTSVSRAIKEYTVLFNRRHNKKRSQGDKIPRTHTGIKTPWRKIWQFLAKLYLQVPLDQAIPLPGICPRDTAARRCKNKVTYRRTVCKGKDGKDCVHREAGGSLGTVLQQSPGTSLHKKASWRTGRVECYHCLERGSHHIRMSLFILLKSKSKFLIFKVKTGSLGG